MNIQKLVLNNFFSYIDSEVDFKEDGIYLIEGVNKQTNSFNGVGKSTIKEAILYALFGKCRVKSIDDCIYFDKKAMLVELTFGLGDIEVRIIRRRIRKQATSCSIFLQGKDCTKQTTKQTDAYIEDILGIDYDKFMHSFCFGQSEFDDLKEMTSSRLIDFLTSVLDINKLDSCKEKIKSKLDEVDNKINKINFKKEAYVEVNSDINFKELKNQKGKLEVEEIKLNEKLKESESKLNGLEATSCDLSKDAYGINLDITNLTERINFIKQNSQCPLCKTDLKGSNLLKELKKGLKNKETSLKFKKDLFAIVAKDVKEQNKKVTALEDILIKHKHRLIEINQDLKQETRLVEKIDIVALDKIKKKLLKQRGILEKSKDVFASKGLPLYILSNYIPKLEVIVNNILSDITDFNLRLKTEKELKSNKELRNVCEIELYKGNRKYPLQNLSNGEEFLITLALRVGISKLYKTGNRIELLILDECFSSLGKKNIQKVISLITNLQDSFKKILVISHIDDVRSWALPHKISIIKDNDVSKIERVEMAC